MKGAAPVVLTIAGSDPSGGAGIQADVKTFAALGAYGTSVVTALTAQNTRGVRGIVSVAPEFVTQQLDAVFDDLEVCAAKTGMLGRVAVIEAVAHALSNRPALPLVVDPVLVATAGQALAEPGVVERLRARLLPLAALVTPNLHEAVALTGRRVSSVADMREAARALVACGARAALVTGGHLAEEARDVLYDGSAVHELPAARLPGTFHGAGCTLSAAITVGLAQGLALLDAVAAAKRYVTRALAAAPARGGGARPLDPPPHG
jgi:hydroxymethylpyrimidine/phosphomethylpyrimidine kinase